MKIMIIGPNVGMGGVERASSNIANGLKNAGNDVTYLALILLVHLIEKTFQIKPFELQYTEIKLVTITLIAIAISCGVEFYSIFFENLPTAGFSLEDKFMKAFNKVKSIFTKVKNFKDGQVD